MMDTYVFDGVEVTKTGRRASRRLPSGKEIDLLEITPATKTEGVWKKWVKDVDLYRVLDDNVSCGTQ